MKRLATPNRVRDVKQIRAANTLETLRLECVLQIAAEAAAPEREARVARIAALYQAGTYHVDAEAVSQRIIEDSIFIP